MSRHLFTSDLHLGGHEKVAALRGFSSVEEHDAEVVSSLAEATVEGDVLWILGDLVGRASHFRKVVEDLREDLPGVRLRLVLGNHDPAHPMNPRAFRYTADLGEVFEWWGTAAETRIQGERVVLSHFPYSRDRGEPRYLQWRLPNRGAWLLHGHTHGEERVTAETTTFHTWDGAAIRRSTPEKEVHVGWDAWKRPVADYEIHLLMREAFVEEANALDPRFAPFEETDLQPYLAERDRVLGG